MNFLIIAIVILVITSLITMLTTDFIEEQDQIKRTEIRQNEIDQLQISLEAREKKNIVFLNLGEEQ